MQSQKNWKNCQIISNKRGLTHTLIHDYLRICIYLFLALSLSSCATKPWKDELVEDHLEQAKQHFNKVAKSHQVCPPTLEADLRLDYQTPVDKKALKGFFQFSRPANFKFIITNPFGQPVLVIAGNKKSFQYINTISTKYIAGSVASFGLRSDIPEYFLKGNWGDWITGQISLDSDSVIAASPDKNGAGVWFTTLTGKQAEEQKVHHLIDPKTEKVVSRILEKGTDRLGAEIEYTEYVNLGGGCALPSVIAIRGLNYGSEAHLQLSNISLNPEQRTYKVKVPQGYFQQYLP